MEWDFERDATIKWTMSTRFLFHLQDSTYGEVKEYGTSHTDTAHMIQTQR